jgi:NAD(P)-dependent dehydrogenase (short-subunit alcohol dehydrogenase family)
MAGLAGGAALGFGANQSIFSNAKKQTVTLQPSGRFKNKVVAITGATSGIGRAAAIAFAREGAKNGFCGRRENLGQEVEDFIKSSGGEAVFIKADVRVEKDVQRFIEQVVQQYGHLDIAFNNAGIALDKSLHEYTLEE